MEKNITLIGMMGVGKSSVAEYLAEMMPDYICIDTDNIIQTNLDMSINDIFNIKGEKFFREKETFFIKKIYKNSKQVIALGGGAFENEENRKIISENSIVIYLSALPETLYSRLKDSYQRPLLENGFSINIIRDILCKRDKNYNLANFVIKTDNKDAHEIAKEISGILDAKYKY